MIRSPLGHEDAFPRPRPSDRLSRPLPDVRQRARSAESRRLLAAESDTAQGQSMRPHDRGKVARTNHFSEPPSLSSDGRTDAEQTFQSRAGADGETSGKSRSKSRASDAVESMQKGVCHRTQSKACGGQEAQNRCSSPGFGLSASALFASRSYWRGKASNCSRNGVSSCASLRKWAVRRKGHARSRPWG
jgi:hypothetical protein